MQNMLLLQVQLAHDLGVRVLLLFSPAITEGVSQLLLRLHTSLANGIQWLHGWTLPNDMLYSCGILTPNTPEGV